MRGIHIFVSEAPATRIGRLLLAGQVSDSETTTPHALRVMPGYILSVVTAGHGSFRSTVAKAQDLGPGSVTLVRPGDPHWYGTAQGQRWTELFAVFVGPVFDTLAASGVLPPTRSARPSDDRSCRIPADNCSAHLLARTTPPNANSFALAGWLLDVYRPHDERVGSCGRGSGTATRRRHLRTAEHASHRGSGRASHTEPFGVSFSDRPDNRRSRTEIEYAWRPQQRYYA